MKRILFIGQPYSNWQLALEGILAQALKLRGADVHFVTCKGEFPICDVLYINVPPAERRNYCQQHPCIIKAFMDAVSVPYENFDRYISPEIRQEVEAWSKLASTGDLSKVPYKGKVLYPFILPSLKRFFRRVVNYRGDDREIVLDFLKSGALALEASTAILKSLRPDTVVLFNGQIYISKIVLDLLRETRTEVFCCEHGSENESVFLTEGTAAVPHQIEKYWDLFSSHPLPDPERREVEEYMSERERGKRLHYEISPTISQNPDTLRERLGILPGTRVASLFASVTWDSAFVDEGEVFDGQIDWVLQTINFFAEKTDWNLVIRIHPAETKTPSNVTNEFLGEKLKAFHLPPNVIIVGPDHEINSYALMRASDLGIVYSSTTGLEMAVMGKPVVVAGSVHYKGKGFTYDVQGRFSYPDLLEKAVDIHSLSCEQVEMAKKYAHLFFIQNQVKFPLIEEYEHACGRLRFSSIDALAPGKDPALDRIASTILGEREWIQSAEEQNETAWASFYEREIDFNEYVQVPYIRELLAEVERFSGGKPILEVGFGTGYSSIFLSKQGLEVDALDSDPLLVKRASEKNKELGGTVRFLKGDAFDLKGVLNRRYGVIFHQGLLEHFSDRKIVDLLKQQLEHADHVVFSVPSQHWPTRDMGDERLLSREEWQEILRSFPVEKLVYHDTYPGIRPKEHILGILASPSQGVARNDSGILYEGTVWAGNGYGCEARDFIKALRRKDVKIALKPVPINSQAPLDKETHEELSALLWSQPPKERTVHLHHLPPDCYYTNDNAIHVGRTMFETDRIPPDWVPLCNQMEEVWVPSTFNMETFHRSGVHREKLFLIPGCIDFEAYNPEKAVPLEVQGKKGFSFLSIFDWNYRKGWDVLLRAFVLEFTRNEDVSLILKTTSIVSQEDVREKISGFLQRSFGLSLDEIPSLIILSLDLAEKEMPSLYAAAQAFVLPSRGEGYGRPYLEAMAMGLPTIGTKWGGNLDFMNDENSFIINIEGLVDVNSEETQQKLYHGHKWAEPSVEHLRQLMRYVYENREMARQRASVGRKEVRQRHSYDSVSSLVLNRLHELSQKWDAARTADRSRISHRTRSLKVLMQNRPDMEKLPGGDGIVLKKTKEQLEKLGVRVDVSLEEEPDLSGYDLVHLFNITRAAETHRYLKHAGKHKKPVVVTPLYEDFPLYFEKALKVQWLFRRHLIERRIPSVKEYLADLSHVRIEGNPLDAWEYRVFGIGNTALQKEIIGEATIVIPNSHRELTSIRERVGEPARSLLVPYAADHTFSNGDPGLFKDKYGVDDFILCVGRLELRKNQLMLLYAMKDLDLPIVLVGYHQDPSYYELCKKMSKDNVLFIERVTAGELSSAYAAAKLHILPSWYELPGLTSLEAALAGCNIVTTSWGSALDYFGEKAWYCTPSDPDSVRQAVIDAYEAVRGERQARSIGEALSWESTALATLEAYEEAVRAKAATPNLKTSIIVVTFNSSATIFACVESIRKNTHGPYELLVVDNASTDSTLQYLSKAQDIKLIANEENCGFARACNQGAELSDGDILVFLNPDTVVPEGWNKRLSSHFRDGIGALGPVSNYVAGLQNSSLYLDPDTFTESHDPENISSVDQFLAKAQKGKEVETKLLIGFCLMVPRKIWSKIGPFDEDLFLGNEDLEYSWRLRESGYKLLVAPDTFVYHRGQVSFSSVKMNEKSPPVQESTDILYWKLEEYYKNKNEEVPSPQELWGINWFEPSPVSSRMKAMAQVASRYMQTGQKKNALEWIEKLARQDKVPARRWLEKEIAGIELSPEDRVILGRIYLTLGDDGKAFSIFSDLMKKGLESSEVYYWLGETSLLKGNLQDALDFFDEALELNPSHPRAWYRCGKILEGDGKIDLACGAYIKALQIDPGFREAKEALKSSLLQKEPMASEVKDW